MILKKKILNIRPLKNANGFNVRAIKSYNVKHNNPPKKVAICTVYRDEYQLPLTNGKNVYIKNFDYHMGLVFSLDFKNES